MFQNKQSKPFPPITNVYLFHIGLLDVRILLLSSDVALQRLGHPHNGPSHLLFGERSLIRLEVACMEFGANIAQRLQFIDVHLLAHVVAFFVQPIGGFVQDLDR